METALELSRWREPPRGVGYRRWTIVATGLRQIFRLRFFRVLLVIAWVAGALMAVMGFVFSQSVADGGWLEAWAVHLGPRAEALAKALGGFVVLYPDICIRGLFTLIFWVHSFIALWLSLVALTVMVPGLITRDRATNALTVYLSRPLTTVDYLLGKLGIIAGVLAALWTGPLIFGWGLSMLFAPNRDFLFYSSTPLLRALLFNAIGLVSLAAIALGTSALGRSSRNTVLLWIGLWIIAAVLAAPNQAPSWIRRASFSHDLNQIRQEVFRLDEALNEAGSQLPLLNRGFADGLVQAGKKVEASDFAGALAGLGLLTALSSWVFFRKLRTTE